MKNALIRKAGCGYFIILIFSVLLSGCALQMGPSATDILRGMGRISDNSIVRDGLPTYIIMIESMLSSKPDDPELLEAAAQLYSMYGTYFVEDQSRARTLTNQALEYAFASAALTIPGIQNARSSSFPDFEKLVKNTGINDASTLFFAGSVWLDWVRVRKDDLDAVADLPMIQLLMQRVTELEPDYRSGMATLYLALLESMDYVDELSVRSTFELAVKQAAGHHLMADVFYGIWLTNNQEEEEGCLKLNEVISSGVPDSSEFAMFNDFALKQAQQTVEILRQSGQCPAGVK